MRFGFIIAVSLALPSILGCSGKAKGDGYALVWSDEFDGTGLDLSKWQVEENGWGGGNGELQYYAKDNVGVAGGNLVLTARRQESEGRHFTSGRLNTKGRFAFTYGKVEARIKLPKTANGLWPAFWLLGADIDDNPWPGCGEIDIMEMGHSKGIAEGRQEHYFNGACHWGKLLEDGTHPYSDGFKDNTYSLQDGQFHTFTMTWDKDGIKMYLDAGESPDPQPYYELDISDTTGHLAPGKYFHHDHFIVLNLAIGGIYTDIYDPDDITALDGNGEAEMLVDYVRVYRKLR